MHFKFLKNPIKKIFFKKRTLCLEKEVVKKTEGIV